MKKINKKKKKLLSDIISTTYGRNGFCENYHQSEEVNIEMENVTI